MRYDLIPPNDPRVLSSVAIFEEKNLKEQDNLTPKEFTDNMFETMKVYGGIGLSANQVGKPYRMFVMGDHLNIENGKKWVCYNPEILKVSKEQSRFKEGCLTFPFLFLDIKRPSAIEVKYLNEDLKEITEQLSGLPARCFLHEYDHMQGIVFTEKVSKLKLDLAIKKRDKQIKKLKILASQNAKEKSI